MPLFSFDFGVFVFGDCGFGVFLRFQKFSTVFYSDFHIFYKISSFIKKHSSSSHSFYSEVFPFSSTLTCICLFFVFLGRFFFVPNFFFFHSIPIFAWVLFLSCFSFSNQPLTRLIAVASFARLVTKSRETAHSLVSNFPRFKLISSFSFIFAFHRLSLVNFNLTLSFSQYYYFLSPLSW